MLDAILTFLFQTLPGIMSIVFTTLGALFFAWVIWGMIFSKEKAPTDTTTAPRPDDEQTFEPQETAETIADAIHEVRNDGPGTRLDF